METEPLTPRQQEVTALLAAGLTNREIAERLFVAERTAEGHVEQIRQKLGLRSRTQIVTWAHANGFGPPATLGSAEITETAGRGPGNAFGSLPPRPRHRRAPAAALVGGLVIAAAITAVVWRVGGHHGQPEPVIRALATPAGALERPLGVAVGRSGDLYVTEGHRVLRVSGSGTVSTFTGGVGPGASGDGGPAADATLDDPRAVVADDLGDVFIADTGNNRVRRVDPTGIITTIAGTGVAGFSGDGGAATAAQLDAPTGLALGFGRTLYIGDSVNNRVRQVRADGIITTVAGTGDPGYAGDGTAAVSALLDTPEGLAFDHEGNLFIVDSLNNRIRRVDLSGVITTVAGDGRPGSAGDGGMANLAELHLAAGPLNGTADALAVDTAGRLFVADALNNRVRTVDVSGEISTVAGEGLPGFSGDGKSPARAELNLPLGIALDPQGHLYIADTANNRIRVIA
jgi:DNA-binding CsgD family transcriptional regulator/sugar lactone lactonase YvrE